MIKDSKYRPLFLKGKEGRGNYSVVVVCRNDEETISMNKIKIVLKGCNNFLKGYKFYLFQEENLKEEIVNHLKLKGISYICGVHDLDTLRDKDVIEINPVTCNIRVLYRSNSNDNFLMLTNKCNNNCIMCPDSLSVRTENNNIPLHIIKRHIKLIDKSTTFLCITGGEPTLLRDDFIEIIKYCKEKLPNTKYLLLTNGRIFYYKNFTETFIKNRPKDMVIAIPIHAHEPKLHDYISSIEGSFVQTFYGVKNLLDKGEKIEIRIVVNKLNYNMLKNIAFMINKYFAKVFRVSFMAMEMLGNAVVNNKEIWISFKDVQTELKQAVLLLLKSGIEVKIYNFPLCSLDKSLWSLNVRSISDYKVRYKDKCKDCSVIEKCGGFFNSTINMEDIKVHPVKG
ncbi:His-Xaa-Ser system radical SAM maturase HxsC [Clostridium sp. PL3]|uniref:His-Xaa-Ser system radical SAM maturase HxsC n=1 Tax=Clostridium thailandense TaxID=2794346 RepID=A0A949TNL3_9CLOT|nr:His-Xaa-Ser system radical SAM maturase HxsC [Clostridium thailandense]MBV7276159.1 His-Xaa-Ser system radical SAM maturase HxsC [Clostridium thailandense]